MVLSETPGRSVCHGQGDGRDDTPLRQFHRKVCGDQCHSADDIHKGPAQGQHGSAGVGRIFRLRLRGLIKRIPGTQRYEVTDSGQRRPLFWLGSLSQTIRPLATTVSDVTRQGQILNTLRKTRQKILKYILCFQILTHLQHVLKSQRS